MLADRREHTAQPQDTRPFGRHVRPDVFHPRTVQRETLSQHGFGVRVPVGGRQTIAQAQVRHWDEKKKQKKNKYSANFTLTSKFDFDCFLTLEHYYVVIIHYVLMSV